MNKSYMIQGKLDGMKKSKVLSDGYLTTNLIYGMIFTVNNEAEKLKLDNKVKNLQADNGGIWKLKAVNWN